MKILLVSDSFLPTLGGMENYVYTLAKFLSSIGNSVTVLTKKEENLASKESMEGFSVARELEFTRGGNILNYYVKNMNIRKTVTRYAKEFDIIHYNGENLLAFIGLRRKVKSPLVITIHGYFPICVYYTLIFPRDEICANPALPCYCTEHYTSRHPTRRFLSPIIRLAITFELWGRRTGLKAFDRIICVSNYVQEVLRNVVDERRLLVVPNFIDLEEIEKAINESNHLNVRKTLGIPAESKMILFGGRLSHEKGVEVLLRGFLQTPRQNTDTYLVIAGEGPERNRLKQMRNEHHDHVVFTGKVSRQMILQSVVQSDVFVLPSIWPEPCPTSLLEAMALQKTIVATNVGGTAMILKRYKDKFLVQPNDHRDLAKKLAIAASLGAETKKFKRRRPTAGTFDYDIHKIGHKLLELYSTLCASQGD